jgi:hypothetical protein
VNELMKAKEELLQERDGHVAAIVQLRNEAADLQAPLPTSAPGPGLVRSAHICAGTGLVRSAHICAGTDRAHAWPRGAVCSAANGPRRPQVRAADASALALASSGKLDELIRGSAPALAERPAGRARPRSAALGSARSAVA